MSEAINNTSRHRYEMVVNDWMAYVTYAQTGNEITLLHTCVPTALEGQGIGSELARSVLDDIRQRNLRVVPECAFIAGFIKRHREFQDLLAASAQGLSS
jgi:predicted GNAT family acetyltransferase